MEYNQLNIDAIFIYAASIKCTNKFMPEDLKNCLSSCKSIRRIDGCVCIKYQLEITVTRTILDINDFTERQRCS